MFFCLLHSLAYIILSSSCGICNRDISVEETDLCIECVRGCEKLIYALCVKYDLDCKKSYSNWDWKCKECRNISSSTISV